MIQDPAPPTPRTMKQLQALLETDVLFYLWLAGLPEDRALAHDCYDCPIGGFLNDRLPRDPRWAITGAYVEVIHDDAKLIYSVSPLPEWARRFTGAWDRTITLATPQQAIDILEAYSR